MKEKNIKKIIWCLKQQDKREKKDRSEWTGPVW